MSSVPTIDPDVFLTTVTPLLRRQDFGGLVETVRTHWTDVQVAELFASPRADVRKVAALSFGMMGSRCCLDQLVPLLKDPDCVVAQMTEHAMWSIWFRLGTKEANHEVCRGTRALSRGEQSRAVEHFTRAIEIDPTFAEAYNQRAIACFMLDRFDDSLEDCRRTIERMPYHFGALAGMGHCHAHEGRVLPALRCYEKALRINPRLDDIRAAIDEMKHRCCVDADASFDNSCESDRDCDHDSPCNFDLPIDPDRGDTPD